MTSLGSGGTGIRGLVCIHWCYAPRVLETLASGKSETAGVDICERNKMMLAEFRRIGFEVGQCNTKRRLPCR